MKLLYYSTAYHASHGGSTHSKHFFEEAGKHPLVKEMFLFPPQRSSVQSHAGTRGRLRGFVRRSSIAQIFFFLRRNRFHYNALVRFIGEHKPDAIVMRLDSNVLQVRWLIDKFPNVVIATEVNASAFDETFKNIACVAWFRKMEQRILSLSLNFFVSDYLRSRIMKEPLDKTRNVVVHNGVDVSKFYPFSGEDNEKRSVKVKEGDFIIGYIGTLDVHKRVDVLLRAFKTVLSKRNNVRLLIVGHGPDEYNLKRLSAELNIYDNVEFVGWVSHDDVPNYIRAFDLAIHHYAENYMSPLKLFEYVACGVPVIGPKTPAVSEIFTHNEHMILTEGTEAGLANEILTVLENPIKMQEIARNGYELVSGSFTWKQNADLIVRTLQGRLKHMP